MSMKVPVGHSVLPILGSVVAALHCFGMPIIDRGFLDDGFPENVFFIAIDFCYF